MTTTMTTIDRIRELKTPAHDMLKDLYDACVNCLEIPNSLLPDHLRGKTGRMAKDILHPKLTTAEIKKQETEDRLIEKSLRLESYCADSNADREIRFHEDEERLYRNQITFANLIGIEFDE